MDTSDRDLARSPFFPALLALVSCPECHFVGHWEGSDRPDLPCPNCGHTGEPRWLFPGGSAYELLHKIAHFYTVANDRKERVERCLLEKLTQLRGNECTLQIALNAQYRVSRIYVTHGGSQEAYEMLLSAVRESLSLDSAPKAKEALLLLMPHTDTVEEHGSVVTLTCTLLESLLDELLALMLQVRMGYDQVASRQKLNSRQCRPLGERMKLFERIHGAGLEDVMAKCAIPGFWDMWKDLRDIRNPFVHGDHITVGHTAAENGFQLATNSVAVFAFLQNQTCSRYAANGSQGPALREQAQSE